MHSAPSVTYPVGRSLLTGALLVLATSGGVAATLGALRSDGLHFVLGLALAPVLGLWAALHWWRTANGELSWDGRGWQWAAARRVDSPVPIPELLVCLDFQWAMLLRVPMGVVASRWFLLERSRCPDRWDAVRRAVYSPASQEAPLDGPPVRTNP